MLRELADPAVVGAPRALGEAFELDEAVVILIPKNQIMVAALVLLLLKLWGY